MIGHHSRFRHDEDDEEEDEAARTQTWEKEETEGFAVVFMSEVYK
jgi:hypothetical protein